MGKLEWDKIGERRYETGVDHVVLYKNNGNSAYAWNGITGITENPSGAEPSILWANNKKYMTFMELVTDSQKASDFINGVLPTLTPEQKAQIKKTLDEKGVSDSVTI